MAGAFLYTNNEISDREYNPTIPFKIASEKKTKLNNKKIRIDLIKEVRDLYTENYTTFIKETEDDSNKWKDIPCFCTRRILLKWHATQNNLQT